ncbi:S-layer homology domain-containing protein [Priestia koreensis]|uniref:S-layer homology domain-containing protein n=1 Tax=Priestia koreensis TaxID=284581 RepID=UPI00204192C2|nr:S-layer homology domain-containing protein [Priestia koreensis]MCM3004624.1 S-layer homology domain-containing protein [Priestia koreensis]
MAYQPKSYRKFIATAATATMVAGAVAPLASFAATDATGIYKDAVNYLIDKGIASGIDKDTFGVQLKIKRGDAAIMVANALGVYGKDAKDAGFKDLNNRIAKAVNPLKEAGIISGKTATEFKPDANITRGEMAIIVSKAYNLKAGADVKNPFKDATGIYKDAVLALYSNKVASGTTADMFGTTSEITRGQFAIFLYNVENLTIDKDKPEITLTGNADVAVQYGSEYTDAGATAVDKVDGKVEVKTTITDPAGKVVDKVDTKVVGKYTITYTAVDSAGNKAEATRTVTVSEDPVPNVESVSATSATEAKVTFKSPLPEGADFNNFEINGGLVVTDAKVSADRKSATLTFNRELTRNQEYTITVTGFKDNAGKPYPDTTGKFTWSVAEGVTVALDSTTLEQGEVTGLTVKDAGGKLVTDAKVEVKSYNVNLVQVNDETDPTKVKLTAQPLAGNTDIEVTTSLPDGTVLTNTFKVTVKEAVTSIANKGYTLLSTAPTSYKYDNTTAFSKFASANTDVEVGSTMNLVAFTETNGQPDAAPIDFAGATVKTSNGIVATPVVEGSDIKVTGNAVGTATLTVTLNDAAKTKKTFAVNVTAEPKLTDVLVDATSVKLSDEQTVASTTSEGVTEQTVTVNAIDQFKDAISFSSTGKVTVSTSTSGLVLGGLSATPDVVTGLTNNLDFTDDADKLTDEATFTIGSTSNTPITNGKVTVNYFAKATDTKPTATKVITVNVVDVDATVTPSDIDVVAPATEVDANAKNTASVTDVDAINFTGSKAFLLDSKGNRIGTTPITSATLATGSVNDKTVGIKANELIFSLDGGTTDDTAKVLTYGRNAAGTVNVNVSNGTITKTVAVKYKNTAVLPNKATVATTPVSIKIPTGAAGTVTLEDIIFGKVDGDNADGQLLIDKVNNVEDSVYGIAKTAKNAGYVYNKPVVSFTGTDNKALSIGTGLYGSTLTELSTSANLWSNGFTDSLNTLDFLVHNYDVDFAITNVVKTTNATLEDNSSLADKVTLPASTDYATFTLVVKGIYIKGAPQATTEEKAANNLLASPVQVNVNVSAK